MLGADYTQSWSREYRGQQYSTIEEELDRFQSVVDEHDLDESLFDAKALVDDSMERYHDFDAVSELDEDQIYAVAAEYAGDDEAVRLEFDRNPIVGDEFRLYVEGDSLFRDDVTATMEVAATPTRLKAVRDLLP